MSMLIIIIIAAVVVFMIAKEKGLWAARTRNTIVSWATGQEGLCSECRHCVKDNSHRFSDTDYFCGISKCDHITKFTRMQCFEKPKIRESDLNQLFSLEIWNDAGMQYLRQNLLGKAMTFTELNEYLNKLPHEHPEYIDKEKKAAYASQQQNYSSSN